MIFEFGQYKVDIDLEKTKHFYEGAELIHENCSCDGCLNFEKAVSMLPQSVRDFFAGLGVDMQKACECYVNGPKDEKTLLYGGFYHLCGKILAGEHAWKDAGNGSRWNEKAAYFITPNFQVSFSTDVALLEAGFPQPVIQLEFLADIPWVLERKNPYKELLL